MVFPVEICNTRSMRVHTQEKIGELKKLRQKGYSINELVTTLSIPKTTVWYHTHAVKVLTQYKELLAAKRGGSANRKRIYLEKAQSHVQSILAGPHRELAIVVAMLYWGEGSKKVCEFINSDGKMLQVYLKMIRVVLEVQEERIKPTLRIFTGMYRKEALKYWSDITDIPAGKFLVRLNDGGTRGKTRYGVCRITVRKGHYTLKIFHALINQIFSGIINS